MSSPRLLIDNDIFILLAGAELLEQAVVSVGFLPADCRYLPALPYMLRRGNLRKRYTDQILQRVERQCAQMQSIDEAPNDLLADLLSRVPKVDPGEVVLYGLLAAHPLYLLTSNDKRAMQAIATDANLASIRSVIAGRIICLETILLQLVKEQGVVELATRFAPMQSSNMQLAVFFSSACLANPNEYGKAVQSYYDDLVQKVGPGFLWHKE